MKELIAFLDSHAGTLQLLFSFLVTASTVAYVTLTRVIVSETVKMRRAQTEPLLAITIEPREGAINFIDMTIQNVGQGPAYSITLKPDRDFNMLHGIMLSDVGIFSHTIPCIRPGQIIKLFLTSTLEDKENKVSLVCTITSQYSDHTGAKYSDCHPIDFAPLQGMHQVGTPTLDEISEHLRVIADALRGVTSGFDKISVRIFSPEDTKREGEENEQWFHDRELELAGGTTTTPQASVPAVTRSSNEQVRPSTTTRVVDGPKPKQIGRILRLWRLLRRA